MTFWRVSLSFELYGIRELKKFSKIYFDKSWIINSVRNWRKQPFASPTLNPIWQLWPSFTIWETRKERNCRIFQNKDSTRDLIWAKVRSNILQDVSPHSLEGLWFSMQSNRGRDPRKLALWHSSRSPRHHC